MGYFDSFGPPESKPTVLLDCDGVLADYAWAYCRTASTVASSLRGTPVSFNPEMVTQWDTAAALDLSMREKSQVEILQREPGWCRAIDPYPGARSAISRLSEIAEVYVVTAPLGGAPWWYQERVDWLGDLGVPPSRVLFASSKHLVTGDFIVEDNHRNMVEWELAQGSSGGMMWRRPWNEVIAQKHGIEGTFVVECWDDVIDPVKRCR